MGPPDMDEGVCVHLHASKNFFLFYIIAANWTLELK